tara:strand:+ start:636 stop:893 length:258 start_codon:yes stop_codon:yes gene_type:complete
MAYLSSVDCDLARSINRIRHPLYLSPYTRNNHISRLADDQAPPAAAADQEVSFIDLGALSSSSEGRAWNIVLSLGNGVELRLSQS